MWAWIKVSYKTSDKSFSLSTTMKAPIVRYVWYVYKKSDTRVDREIVIIYVINAYRVGQKSKLLYCDRYFKG